MMIRPIIIALMVLCNAGMAAAQQLSFYDQVPPDHSSMMNDTWEAINTLMYKVSYKDEETIFTPYFPDRLKALDKKTVTLPGYLIPMDNSRDHSRFMWSVLPINQCMFCGQDNIPPMVEVVLKSGNKIRYTERPFKVKGEMRLNASIENWDSIIQIVNAEVLE